MTLKNKLMTGLVALAISCTTNPMNTEKTVELVGKPINVSTVYGKQSGTTSVVLEVKTNQGISKVLAYSRKDGSLPDNYHKDHAQVNTLIQSEISDSDNEEIKLQGYRRPDNQFEYVSVEADGIKVKLK
jgi:hypothetical protein